LLPLFVAAFYGGMIVIDLVAYPMLSFWRGWLRRRGLVDMVIGRGRGALGRDDARLVPALPVVVGMELE
jgi:hypothetical protein